MQSGAFECRLGNETWNPAEGQSTGINHVEIWYIPVGETHASTSFDTSSDTETFPWHF
ncbi:hypothetical protein MGYG_03985 [Nannizzia gypsea CBS 118893]|uniref:Uncharacterized protein n=1 Tax=Arthroderma gypseum (strain ATCC MYA-4604 / CBS 118893) TaxID=535722 RepID=E4UUL7_ARTGP|nr:hypothetical protein MGYG_03985 [Nannizzia gypsea CBS 118893]EFR00984.1 hypothetical protein MGYG_03985 [Nannizzia gypsea CBS 118893]